MASSFLIKVILSQKQIPGPSKKLLFLSFMELPFSNTTHMFYSKSTEAANKKLNALLNLICWLIFFSLKKILPNSVISNLLSCLVFGLDPKSPILLSPQKSQLNHVAYVSVERNHSFDRLVLAIKTVSEGPTITSCILATLDPEQCPSAAAEVES